MGDLAEHKLNENKFIECLNEILSAENAIVERLHKRIQETPFSESKNTLQEELSEEKDHQNRLKNLILQYGRKPTESKAKLVSLNPASDQTIDITDNSSDSDKKIKSTFSRDEVEIHFQLGYSLKWRLPELQIYIRY